MDDPLALLWWAFLTAALGAALLSLLRLARAVPSFGQARALGLSAAGFAAVSLALWTIGLAEAVYGVAAYAYDLPLSADLAVHLGLFAGFVLLLAGLVLVRRKFTARRALAVLLIPFMLGAGALGLRHGPAVGRHVLPAIEAPLLARGAAFTRAEKGALGERASANLMEAMGYACWRTAARTYHGLDVLCAKGSRLFGWREIVVVESKVGGGRPNRLTGQMTDSWLLDRLARLRAHDDVPKRVLALAADWIETGSGRLRRLLHRHDLASGTTKVYELDGAADIVRSPAATRPGG